MAQPSPRLSTRIDFDLNDPLVLPSFDSAASSSLVARDLFLSGISYFMYTLHGSSSRGIGVSSKWPMDGGGDETRSKRLILLNVCHQLSRFLSCYNKAKSARLPLRSYLTLTGRIAVFRGVVIPFEGSSPLLISLPSLAISWHVAMLLTR